MLSPRSGEFGELEKQLEDPCATPTALPLEFLKAITGGFSDDRVLGKGTFGVVYKGVLGSGKEIAVKKLLDTHLDDDEFRKEATCLIKVKHPNVVQLVGYCSVTQEEAIELGGKYVMADIRHRLICFEHLKNKSLDNYLSDESCGLEWQMRFQMIRRICCGLHYLHKECHMVHLDLKPQNILLDDDMAPKIADFGTAKLFVQQQSRVITEVIRGTLGYMAPEYLRNGLISTKADIFSLGIIIIQLVTGSNFYPYSEASFKYFIENVVEKWRNRLENAPTDTPSEIYIRQVKKCMEVGLQCIDTDPNRRPAAWGIIKELEAAESENGCCGMNEGPLLNETGLSRNADAKEKLPLTMEEWMRASVLPYMTMNIRYDYLIGRKLGQGHSGDRYQCERKVGGTQYACKIIPKRKLLYREDLENVWSEIQIMHHLSDIPNVVCIRNSYEDKDYVHIVMDLCAGMDLSNSVIAGGPYSERAAAQLIRTIVKVIEGCHSLGVMHRDIKPENFVFASIEKDSPLMANDFGLSVFYRPGDKFSDVVGRPYYIAPEVLRKCYGPEADIWSAGVILYFLLCGSHPFFGETEEEIFREILQGKLNFDSHPWLTISDAAKDLIRNMLTRDPKKRFTAHEVLCHPWINPREPALLLKLKQFSSMKKLKKMALRVLAENLSVEEVGGLTELFKMFDSDSSGTITSDELKVGLKRVGAELTKNEVQALMEAIDLDNSGTIDYGEFVAAMFHMNKLERDDALVAAFSYFDRDGSGLITIDDLSQACCEFGLENVNLEDMIKDFDQDNDGQINYSEFASTLRKGNAV